jgi:ABC-type glycerol-3-phosphate transport system permease component
MVIINDIEKITISGGLLLSFSSQYATNYPVTFAGYLLASAPLILVFIFANKFYIEGLISTSIKM